MLRLREGRDLVQRLNKRLAQLEQERSTWVPLWQQLDQYLLPNRALFYSEKPNRRKDRFNKIYDNTALVGMRTFSSGMMAGLTSPTRAWFRLVPVDEDLAREGEVQEWLYMAETRLRQLLARSNVYKVLPEVYQMLGTFGIAAAMVIPHETNVFHAVSFPVGSYSLAVDQFGQVDALYRRVWMTALQVREKFGEENLSRMVRSLLENDQGDTWVLVGHAIERNASRNLVRRSNRDMEWLSVYWEIGQSTREGSYKASAPLRVSGFFEQPFMAPRWSVNGQDVYGTNSPGMIVLGDVKQLQRMNRQKGQAIEKQIDPPLVAPSTLEDIGVSRLPGDVNYVDLPQGSRGMGPLYEVGFDLQWFVQDMEQVRARIREGLFVDLFKMLMLSDRPQMTAREVSERHEEKILSLGPVLEQLNDELLDKLVIRCLAIAIRTGHIPEPPQPLRGQPPRVEYVSILAQAQRILETAKTERFVGSVAEMAQLWPEVLDTVNPDRVAESLHRDLGVNPLLLRSEEEIAQLREARQQQQEMQQAAAMAQPAQQAAQAVKTVSETDPQRVTDLVQAMMPTGAVGGGGGAE